MAKNVVAYCKGRREYLEYLHKNGFFGLSPSIENKEQALFFAALGCDRPVQLTGKKDEGGWFRTESVINYSKDVAMLSCLLLGTAKTDEDYDKFSQLDAYMDYLEQCAENGFRIVEKKLEECGEDNDLLERRMLKVNRTPCQGQFLKVGPLVLDSSTILVPLKWTFGNCLSEGP